MTKKQYMKRIRHLNRNIGKVLKHTNKYADRGFKVQWTDKVRTYEQAWEEVSKIFEGSVYLDGIEAIK